MNIIKPNYEDCVSKKYTVTLQERTKHPKEILTVVIFWIDTTKENPKDSTEWLYIYTKKGTYTTDTYPSARFLDSPDNSIVLEVYSKEQFNSMISYVNSQCYKEERCV